MKVRKLQLTNFRNHARSSLEFGDGLNVVTGANAQGKTSVLEALSYLCLTKSFLQQSDMTVCRFGSVTFTIDGWLHGDHGIEHRVHVSYERGLEKRYLLDNNEVKKSSEVIGMFPIVVLSPGDFALTSGAPSERRKFIDMVLSQASRSYLEELLEYRRILKQRNKVLLDGKITGFVDKKLLAAWTDALINHGTKVMIKRSEFMGDFQGMFTDAYKLLVGSGEVPQLVYEPSFTVNWGANASASVTEAFHGAISRLAKVEQARGSSLAGPHRDDIAFMLNSVPIREFASQGQHKTFLVALKIAEFHYMKDKLSETPAMLLDDVMTELDYTRASKATRAISELGQSFVTTTDMVSLDEHLLDMHSAKIHFVKDGNVFYKDLESFAAPPSLLRSARGANG